VGGGLVGLDPAVFGMHSTTAVKLSVILQYHLFFCKVEEVFPTIKVNGKYGGGFVINVQK